MPDFLSLFENSKKIINEGKESILPSLKTQTSTPMLGTGNSTFAGITKEQAIAPFVPTKTPVESRPLFSTKQVKTNMPPIIRGLSDIGFRTIEAVPKSLATVAGELGINTSIDMRRFGFDTPEYIKASKEQSDAIARGENPWVSGLRILSNKTLDIAFGASIIKDLLKKSLLSFTKNNVQSRIEAENFINAYKTTQKETFARINNLPLAEREIIMADLANAKVQAEKILSTSGGKVSPIEKVQAKTAPYAEVLSRETQPGSGFAKRLAQPDISLKQTALPKAPYIAGNLPGYISEQQGVKAGLSTEPVKPVGFANKEPSIVETAKSIVADGKQVVVSKTPVAGEVNLLQEAKKYKSAEEFVNTQNKVYRGGEPIDLTKGGQMGISVSTDKAVADRFAKVKKNPTVDELIISPEAKIFDAEKATPSLLKDTPSELAILKYARENGYDAIDFTRSLASKPGTGYLPENEIRVLNPKVLKTKSQLTDIWNKANTGESFKKSVFPSLEKKAPIDDVKKLIFAEIPEKDVNLIFSKTLIDDINMGRYAGVRPEMKGVLKPIIELYEKGGKVSVRTAYHESHHYIWHNFMSEAEKASALALAKSEITKAERVLYKIAGYQGEDTILREFLADKYAKYKADAAGYKGRLQSFFELMDRILKKISDTFKKVSEAYKKSPFSNQKGSVGYNFEGSSNKISPVDRLIAEGKIKINRKGNKDVYSYKKGNIWQTARDEDSAVRAATKNDLPQDLAQRKQMIEFKKEALSNDPLNALTKYVSKRGNFKGQLPEVLGGKGGQFKKRGDDIITEVMGPNTDSETVRSQMSDFVDRKNAILAEEKALKQEIKTKRYSAEGIPLATPASMKSRQTSTAPKKQLLQKESASSPIQLMTGTTGEVRSLERMAEQSATKEILDPQLRKSVSLTRIIEKLPTPVKVKVNALDYIRTPDNVLKKIGLSQNAYEIRKGYEAYLKELPKNLDKITAWSEQVPPSSNKKIFQYLDGKSIDLNQTELKIVNEIKAWLAEWADRLGLPKDNRIADYITHIFDDQLIKKEFDEDLAKIIADKIPGSVYNPFLQARLGAKGYIEDTWKALDAYVKRATRKVNMDPSLEKLQEVAGGLEESQWNYVKRYVDRINMRPTEIDNLVDNAIKSAIGYRLGQRPVLNITRTLRQATYRGMLGLNIGSALRNLSQGINTYAKLGEKYTAIGYISLFKNRAIKELETEQVLNSIIQDRSISAIKKTMQGVDKGLFYFFETAEKINRGAAYFGAKAKGIANGMTESQAIDYAKKIVRETQFAFGSIDTPVGLSSDIVKTLTQFQTFTTKQVEFLAGMVKNKEYAGLIRYVLSGIAFVYTIGQAFGMEPKDLVPIYRIGTPPSLKLPVETIKTVSGGKGDIVGSLPGYVPAGIQAKKSYQGYKAKKEGGSYDASGRLQFATGQSPYAKAQAIIFGKYSSQEAKGYFNRGEISKKEKANVQPIYDEVQKLKSLGNTEEAQSIVDSLSDADYATYKKIKASITAQNTIQGKMDITPTYNEVQSLVKSGNEDKAREIVNGLTDEQYKYYKLVKADKEKVKKAQSGEKPSFDPNEVQSTQGVISTVIAYAKALGTDPTTAFNRIFTGQRIRYVANGTIVVERMPLSASEAEKKAQGSTGSEVKLDHTIPLQLGGSNDKSNLKLVPTAIWESYTDVENAIGKALRDGKVDKNKAQQLIKDFKDGKLSAEEVTNML